MPRWSAGNTLPYSASAVTARINDLLVDDTTTGETASDVVDPFNAVYITGSYDFGSPVTFDQIRMTSGASVAGGFDLYYSLDDISIISITGQFPGFFGFQSQNESFPEITARYVYAVAYDQNATGGAVEVQLTDFRVYNDGVELEEPDDDIGDVIIEPDPEEEETDEGRCGISLFWNDVDNATLYDLERRRPSSDWASLYSGVVNSYQDTTAEVGQDYYYRARARSGTLIGDWSETLVLSNVCEAQWSISPLPEAADYDRDCAPARRTWGKSR